VVPPSIRTSDANGMIDTWRRVNDKEKELMTEKKNHEDSRSHEIDFRDPQMIASRGVV
jgi:hypothetical protein